MKTIYKRILFGALILPCFYLFCATKQARKEQPSTDVFAGMVSVFKISFPDSISIDSIQGTGLKKSDLVRKLNTDFSTDAFSMCKAIRFMRFFRDSGTWVTAVSFMKYPDTVIDKIRKLLDGSSMECLSFEQWNRVSWHIIKNEVALVETYELVDTLFRRINLYLYEKQGYSGSGIFTADSLFFSDSIPKAITAILGSTNKLLAIQSVFPVDALKYDTNGLVTGVVERNNLRWAADTSTPGKFSIAFKYPRPLNAAMAAMILKQYCPDISFIKAAWGDQVKSRYNYFHLSSRILRQPGNGLMFIVFYFPEVTIKRNE